MKKIFILIISILLFSNIAYGADLQIMGVGWKRLDWKTFLAGAAVSVVAHEAGHLIALYATNTEYEFDSITSFTFKGSTPNDARWIARSGFIAQQGIGLILSHFKKESSFTKGFNVMNLLTIATYPLRHSEDGDLNTLNKNGANSDLEYAIFTGIAIRNLIVLEW